MIVDYEAPSSLDVEDEYGDVAAKVVFQIRVLEVVDFDVACFLFLNSRFFQDSNCVS